MDPDVLALETEPDLENSHEVQGHAIRNTHADSADNVEDPELVVLTGAPMVNAPLWPITSFTLLCIEEIKDDTCTKKLICLLDLDSLERISIAVHNISLSIKETQRTILRGHGREVNDN